MSTGIRNNRGLSAVDVDISNEVETRHARLTEVYYWNWFNEYWFYFIYSIFIKGTNAATVIKAPRGAFIFLGIFLILAAGGLIVALTVYFTSKTSSFFGSFNFKNMFLF